MVNLVDLLAEPTRVSEMPFSELDQLAKEYPQSEHVHLLRYLHHLQNTGEIDQQLLTKASLFSSNRSILAEWTQHWAGGSSHPETSEVSEIPVMAKVAKIPTEEIDLAPTWIVSGAEEELIEEKPVKQKKKSSEKTALRKKSTKRKRKKRKTTRLTKIIEEQKAARDPFANGENNAFLQWLKRMDQLGNRSTQVTPTDEVFKKQPKKHRKKKKRDSFAVETDIISETLAELVAQQGRPRKAIAIYEKLCLKYPEKSAFFALKIKDLQDKSE